MGCGLCDTECVDEEEAFDLNDNPMGLRTCAQAISYGAQDRNLCNAPNANLSSFVRRVCRKSCGECEARRSLQRTFRGPRRALQPSLQEQMQSTLSGDGVVKLDGCVDPFVISAVNVLTISLSDEVSIGAILLLPLSRSPQISSRSPHDLPPFDFLR